MSGVVMEVSGQISSKDRREPLFVEDNSAIPLNYYYIPPHYQVVYGNVEMV
jgi:hypothetical protein